MGGTKEILTNSRNGLIARYNDHKDLSKKILFSISQKKYVNEKKLSLFSMENNIKKYKKLFNNC